MRAWTLCKKDLRVYVRDRVGLLLGLGLPLVLAFVFGGAMGAIGGGDSAGMGRARLFVEDRDGSEASRELVAALEDADGLRVVSVDTADPEAETAEERVADADGPAGLLIPAGFGAALEAGELPGLVLYRDPGKTIEQQIIAGNLIPALFEASGEQLGKRAAGKVLDVIEFPAAWRDEAQAIMDRSFDGMEALVTRLEEDGAFEDGEQEEDGFDFATAIADVLGLEVQDVVGADLEEVQQVATQSHAISGIAVMMLLFGLVACGGTLLEEQAGGTLDRLRLAPGRTSEILLGKFLFTWLVGIAQLTILFLVTSRVFAIPIFRAPFALCVLSAAVAAAATGFGILFAVLCKSRSQLEGLSTVVILTMSAFGGSWWPLAITPDWYQSLAHFTLTAWAMDGYQGLFWYGHGLADLVPEIGVLLGIGAATSALALTLWNRRLRIA